MKYVSFDRFKRLYEAAGEISSEKEFKEYLESIYKKAHGDKYKQEIVDKVFDDLMKDYKKDEGFGPLMGRATSGLGESFIPYEPKGTFYRYPNPYTSPSAKAWVDDMNDNEFGSSRNSVYDPFEDDSAELEYQEDEEDLEDAFYSDDEGYSDLDVDMGDLEEQIQRGYRRRM